MPASSGPFPHLPLPLVFNKATERQGGGASSQRTKDVLNDPVKRAAHGADLLSTTASLSRQFATERATRHTAGLPEQPEAFPVFLQIDEDAFDPDGLSAFGIEVLSEEDDGYIVGASADMSLTKLISKINDFLDLSKINNGSPAKIWDLKSGTAWRQENLLSPELNELWTSIQDGQLYEVDVTIGGRGQSKMPERPNDDDSQEKWVAAYEERDRLMQERLSEFLVYFAKLGGRIMSSPAEIAGSWEVRIQVSGKALKDVLTYPYLFGMALPDHVDSALGETADTPSDTTFELLPPFDGAPKVCVIDSGIQQNHRYLEAAVQHDASKSFLPQPDDAVTADMVPPGGHGTRVAGAILYPRDIPISGTEEARVWIQNARVLNGACDLPVDLLPPVLIKDVIEYYLRTFETRIFNHSISSKFPCRTGRMTAWAAAIDEMCFEHDILFITAAGNIERDHDLPTRKSVVALCAEFEYPDFLLHDTCRIANPAQSLQALTVGSICLDEWNSADEKSFGAHGHPSSFSRSGMGLWGTVKPEVVEFGGDYVKLGGSVPALVIRPDSSPELIRSTMHGPGPAYARDIIGTSFATPKVTHIAAELARLFPEEPALLWKALIVQSARWPAWAEVQNAEDVLRWIGYGLPDLERATSNSEYRVTFATTGMQSITPRKMHCFQIDVPEEMRRLGEEHLIRIEITLCYKARPSRQRRTTKRYLSTWLDFTVNLKNEKPQPFAERILGRHDQNEPLEWVISKYRDRGTRGVRRDDNTVQKDWAVVPCHQLPDSLCVAVVGHRGGGAKDSPDDPAEYVLVVTFESEGSQVPIYAAMKVAIDNLQAQQQIESSVEVEISGDEPQQNTDEDLD